MKFLTIAEMIQDGAREMYFLHCEIGSPDQVRRLWLVTSMSMSPRWHRTKFI